MEKKDFYSAAVSALYGVGCTHLGSIETLRIVKDEAFKAATATERTAVDNKATELFNEWETLDYQRLRASEYPSIEDQLDMLFWDKENGTDNWNKSVKEVKLKYPKSQK